MADERYVTGILWQRTGGPEEGQSGAGKGTAFRVLFLAIHAMRPSLRAHVLNPAGPQDPPGPGRRKILQFPFPVIQTEWFPGIQLLRWRPAFVALDARRQFQSSREMKMPSLQTGAYARSSQRPARGR